LIPRVVLPQCFLSRGTSMRRAPSSILRLRCGVCLYMPIIVLIPFFPSSQLSQAARYQEDKPKRASNEASPMLTPAPNRAAASHDIHPVNDAQPPPFPGMPLPVRISNTPRAVTQQIHVASSLELRKYSYLDTASLAKTISISAAAPRKYICNNLERHPLHKDYVSKYILKLCRD
jgi:hypothetical protein